MAIEKYVSTSWQIERVFDSQTKIADFTPSTYVPPEIQAYVDRLKAIADPRFTYVHVIAMTDGDYYGSNLNGDIFTTDQLTGQQTPTEAEKNPGDMAGVALPRYKTFEQAKFFRNHANGNNDPAYGDVPCAAWNDLMRRVELVVRIAKKAIPELGLRDGADICAKLDRRGYLTLSMGTRITHEKCRYCGAENEYIHQRCDHLKNHMNEIMPDGRLVSAENFGCRFFDISDVGVPADPAAYSLSKVASAVLLNHAIDVPGDGYAPWRNKLSEMEKRVLAADPVYDVPSDDVPCSVVDGECTDEFTEPELKAAYVAAHGDLSAVVSTAAAAGMVFSPRELATLTAIHEPSKSAAAVQDFTGFGSVALDKFRPSVYNVLRSKIASRSGFVAPCFAKGWEPSKLAEQGFDTVADYYRFYRATLGSLSRSSFAKAAHRIPDIRELVAQGNVKSALYHLAYAGHVPAWPV